jgi:hypothetical protein
MIIVVDAGVAAKWFIAEENANGALELLRKAMSFMRSSVHGSR